MRLLWLCNSNNVKGDKNEKKNRSEILNQLMDLLREIKDVERVDSA